MESTFFSIIVPTRDRPRSLERCLEAVAQLVYPRDRYEVVVVDDRSRDPVDGIVARFRNRMAILLVRGKGRGPAAARNAGAHAARGEVLAFIDDDCAPRPDWLAALAARIRAEPDAGAGGPMSNRLESSLFSTASQMLIDHLFEYYNTSGENGRFFTTSNLALPARGFREMGGFSSRFGRPGGEDRELVDRWIRSGRRLLWEPAAVVHHHHPLTLGSFLDQHLRYGRGARLFQQARAADGLARPRIEPPRFYIDLLRRPFRIGARRPLRLSALLTLSQLAHAFGYFTLFSGRPARNEPLPHWPD